MEIPATSGLEAFWLRHFVMHHQLDRTHPACHASTDGCGSITESRHNLRQITQLEPNDLSAHPRQLRVCDEWVGLLGVEAALSWSHTGLHCAALFFKEDEQSDETTVGLQSHTTKST